MATTLSSTFDIITELPAGTGTTTIEGPSFDCTCVGIYGTGLATARIDAARVPVGGGASIAMGVVVIPAGDLNDFPATLDTLANRSFQAGETFKVDRSVANSTRIVMRFQARPATTLTES